MTPTTTTTDEAVLPGLSFRVQVWQDGIAEIPQGAVDASNPDDLEPGGKPHLRARFDYLRVTGESIEDALARTRAHHEERWGHLGGIIDAYFLGYNIDDRPVPSSEILRSFDGSPEDGWEWTVSFYGSDEVTRWRTDRRCTGLWRWTGHSWSQHLGHMQFSLPHDRDAAVAYLLRRWGLADWRAQSAAQADDDLITADEVLTVLRQLGRPITAATLRNYRSRPPAGWPQPVKRVGRTPLWSRTAIETSATDTATTRRDRGVAP